MIRFSAAVAVTLSSSFVAAQGLPDCVIGNADPASKSVLRLVDRNADGVYDNGLGAGENEAFDFYKVEPYFFDSSYRTVLPALTVPGSFYMIDGGFNSPEPDWRIILFRDVNRDGFIDNGEITPALTQQFTLEPDMESEQFATDGLAYYMVSNAGDCEGIWRLEDLNGDGDFMDTVNGVDEFQPAVVEVANRTGRVGEPGGGVVGSDAWQIYNTPNTSSAQATFLPTEVQRITFDPTPSAGSLAVGRFLVEDEELDCILAFEDLNGDGDFIDPATSTTDFGEIYLWSQMVDSTNGGNNRIVNDVNPDVTSGALQISWENMAIVDDTQFPRVYYLLNRDGGAAAPAANIIYRAVDNNADGDVNDAGEVTRYFEAKDSDPVRPFNFLQSIAMWNGEVFVSGEAILQQGNRDQILRLHDDNMDGMIDNATEVDVVFTLPANRDLRDLNFFAPGSLGPAPAGLPGLYEYLNDATCMTNAGTAHALEVGGIILGDNVPRLGRVIRMVTRDAPPSAPASMFLGQLAAAPFPLSLLGLGPCSIGVDLGNLTEIPGLTTNVTGGFTLSFAVPNDPGFAGTNLHFETLCLDLVGGPPQVTVSNTVRVQFGTYSYTPPMEAP